MFRNLLSTFCVAIVMMFLTATANALPPEIEADRFLIAAKQALAVEDYAGAMVYFEKVLALKVPVADEFHVHYGKILRQTGNHEGAYKQFETYLNKAGREGAFYMEALEGMTTAEKDIEKVRQQNKARVKKLLVEGEKLRGQSKYKEAIVVYNKVPALSVDADILNNRGNCYWNIKKYDKAIDDFTRAIALKPEAYYYSNRGLVWKAKKDYANAIEDYTEAIKRDPSSANNFYQRAASFHNLGKYDEAITDYSKSIELRPGYLYGYINRSICWENKGELDKAIADRDLAILKDTNKKYVSTKADNYKQRGDLWKKKKDLDKAIADYTVAIGLTPKNHSPLFERGKILYDQKKYDEAIADYTKVITIKPEYSSAYYNRGLCWWKKKDYEKSVTDFTDATKHDPSYTWAYWYVGENRSAKKEWDQAITSYTKAISIDAKHYWSYSGRGIAWVQLGILDSARADFTKMIELRPKSTTGYEKRAAVLIDMGEMDLAVADFAMIIKSLSKSRGYTFDKIVRKFEAKKNYATAISLWDKVIEKWPTADNYRYRANSKTNAGDKSGGIDDFTKAIAAAPEEYDGYSSRAYALRTMGESVKALADYDQTLKRINGATSPLWTLLHKTYLLIDLGRKAEADAAYKLTLLEYDREISEAKENTRRRRSYGKYVPAKVYYMESRAKLRRTYKDYPGAIAEYTKIIEMMPDFTAYYKQRADIRWSKSEEYKLALQDFAKMLELEPDNNAALAGPGIVYYRQGKYRKARKTLLKAAKLKPESVRINKALALFYASCPKESYRDPAKAIKHAKLALESTTRPDPHIYEIMAFALAAGEQFAEAVTPQQTAVSLYKNKTPWNVNAEKRYLGKMQERLVSYKNNLRWEGKGHPLEWLPAKAEFI